MCVDVCCWSSLCAVVRCCLVLFVVACRCLSLFDAVVARSWLLLVVAVCCCLLLFDAVC